MRGTLALTSLLAALLSVGCGSDCDGGLMGSMTATYEQTLDEYAGPVRTDGTRPYCSETEQGRCADGKQFVAGQFYLGGSVRYFDDSHTLVAWAAGWDHEIEAVCPPTRYQPNRVAVRCTIVEHAPLCGEATTDLVLPYAAGR